MTSGEDADDLFTIDSIKVEDGDRSFFSTKVVLSFNHILEQIFGLLDSEDLLNCRLVSHRWLLFAQKPLQTKIGLHFWGNRQSVKNLFGDEFSKYLNELTNLLKYGHSLQDSEDNGCIPIRFPCSRFYFQGINLSNDDLQQFLNTNGRNIQEFFVGTCSEDESILMDHIANLLLNQTPNIQKLILQINPTVKWQLENEDRHGNDRSHLQQSDPEYKEICEKAWALLQSKNGSSLKVLDIFGDGLAKTLEFIIRLSPKLEEVIVDKNRYLIVPENRLHLLKSLIIYPQSSNKFFMEEIENISYGNLRLREVDINFAEVTKWIQKYPDLETKIVDVINRIFKRIRDIVESIQFNKVTFLRGMKLPKAMPKVRKIVISNCGSEIYEETSAHFNNVTVVPMGFNMQKTFPKLRCVHLKNFFAKSDDMFSSFLNCLDFGGHPCDPLSLSVKKVTLFALCSDSQRQPLPAQIFERIHQWFPNASIKYLD